MKNFQIKKLLGNKLRNRLAVLSFLLVGLFALTFDASTQASVYDKCDECFDLYAFCYDNCYGQPQSCYDECDLNFTRCYNRYC